MVSVSGSLRRRLRVELAWKTTLRSLRLSSTHLHAISDRPSHSLRAASRELLRPPSLSACHLRWIDLNSCKLSSGKAGRRQLKRGELSDRSCRASQPWLHLCQIVGSGAVREQSASLGRMRAGSYLPSGASARPSQRQGRIPASLYFGGPATLKSSVGSVTAMTRFATSSFLQRTSPSLRVSSIASGQVVTPTGGAGTDMRANTSNRANSMLFSRDLD